MTPETPPLRGMTCAEADELSAAYALGAVDVDERVAIEAHLASCPSPHAELRSLLGADAALTAGLDPVVPSAALRDRLLRTIAATEQEGVVRAGLPVPERASVPEPRAGQDEPRRAWLDWLSPAWARGLAAAAVVAALALGGWNVALQAQLAARDQQLRAVADAVGQGSTAFRITGSSGSGYVVANPSGKASMVVAGLPAPGAGRIYELWLIGPDNKPVDVGTFDGSEGPVAVVQLERGLSGYTTFAVTIEEHRVEAPTTRPVLSAQING